MSRSAPLLVSVGDDPARAARWQAYAQATPAATPYHDIAWRQIFAEGLGYRSHLLMAERADGEVAGILPLYAVPSPLGGARLVAVPFRDRGGIVCDDDDAFTVLIEGARDLMHALGAAGVEIKTVAPYPEQPVRQAGLTRHAHWTRSRVDLRGLSETSLAEAIGGKRRNMLKQARQAGLSFKDMTQDAGAADMWQTLHAQSQRSLGLPPFPRAFFRSMIGRLAPANKLSVLAIVAADGAPAAATLVLHDRTSAIYAYSASAPGLRQHRPNDLLLFELYLWLAGRGSTEIDLGADSPRQQTLLWFKKQWLAQQAPIPSYSLGRCDPAARDSSSPTLELARRAVRLAPSSVSAALLSPLVRFLG